MLTLLTFVAQNIFQYEHIHFRTEYNRDNSFFSSTERPWNILPVVAFSASQKSSSSIFKNYSPSHNIVSSFYYKALLRWGPTSTGPNLKKMSFSLVSLISSHALHLSSSEVSLRCRYNRSHPLNCVLLSLSEKLCFATYCLVFPKSWSFSDRI